MSTLYSTVKSRTEMTTVTSVGLMPTEARGNYLPEAPYLRETKTCLNLCMRASRHSTVAHPATPVDTTYNNKQRPFNVL